MLESFLPRNKSDADEQASNALSPILSVEFGIVIETKLEQPKNASFMISLTPAVTAEMLPELSVRTVAVEQFAKALSPIVFTFVGIVIYVSVKQPSNAPFEIVLNSVFVESASVWAEEHW